MQSCEVRKWGRQPLSSPTSQGVLGVHIDMEFWTEFLRLVMANQLSKRAACRKFDLSWHTLKKILTHEELQGHPLTKLRSKPKMQSYLRVIQQTLEANRQAPASSGIPPGGSSSDDSTNTAIWVVKDAVLN